ncbi:MAG: hypothetical protein HFJ34_01870 [Clostridia bacterium]|nr:hypothetical protein [Clostridia bacterium]
MSDSLITIVVIILVAILMFVFPLMTVSDRSDDTSQLVVDTSVADFVNNVRTSGKLTEVQYEKFVEEISSTGVAYNVEIEIQQRDETPGKKTTQVSASAVSDANDAYITKYTAQIMDELDANHEIALKQGDFIKIRAESKSTTISQQVSKFLQFGAANDTYAIAAEHAGVITTNGK